MAFYNIIVLFVKKLKFDYCSKSKVIKKLKIIFSYCNKYMKRKK